MPPRILIVPDKFKGSLTAPAAAAAIAAGWSKARPGNQVEILPSSDGGDGFGAVLGGLLGARRKHIAGLEGAQSNVGRYVRQLAGQMAEAFGKSH